MTADPKPRHCPYCDFSMGRRGMDRCATCDGTGSVFFVNRFYPNTKEGYIEACAAAGVEPILEPE